MPLRLLFHAADILGTAVIERCTKTYDKDLILADLILI